MGRRGSFAALGAALALLAGCSSGRGPARTTSPSSPPSSPSAPSSASSPSPTGTASIKGAAGVLVTGLEVPWGLAFLPSGAALVSQRDRATVSELSPGRAPVAVGTVSGVVPGGEGGLLGLAVSPSFATDRLVYAYTTTADDNRIVSFQYRNGAITDQRPVFTGLPKSQIHNGGRIAFGPDGFLYVTVGDAGQRDRAPDWNYLGGKVLRMTAAGKPAAGNPRSGSVIYTVGHRNPQGLAWGPDGSLYEAEFGQNSEDEINLLEPGADYGWPTVEGDLGPKRSGLTPPLLTWSTDDASPSGLAYLDGALWLATLQGERLYRIPVTGPGQVGTPSSLLTGKYGRLRTVVAAPDGSLWVTTSNRDGRGDPGRDDDRILRVT